MGFWVLQLVRDDSVTACAPMPTDLREVTKPASYDRAAPYVYDRVVPQLTTPSGKWKAVQRRRGADRRPVLRPARLTAKRGREDHLALRRRRAAQRDRRQRPARLLLQLPRQHERALLVHADRPRHLPADVPDPPDDDGQTLKVARGTLKKFRPRPSSVSWAWMLSCLSSPVKSRMPIVIRITPESAVITR